MKGLALAVLLLAGCSHTAWQVGAGTPHAGAQVQVDGGRGLAALFGLTILAAGVYEASRGGVDYAGSTQRAPEMAPDRKVSEQDCTKPLDYTLGNIRCK
ncbi:MAG: hypothetical protein ACREUS_11245 [Burkholderiales bacterium]